MKMASDPETPTAYLTCFAPQCGAIATHGKYCRAHKDFDRILREQVVILEDIGADPEVLTMAKAVVDARPETPTNERPEHASNCPGWGAWDIPGACNCGGKYREDHETPTVERFWIGKQEDVAIYASYEDDWIFSFDAIREFVGTRTQFVRYTDYLTLHAECERLRDDLARLRAEKDRAR